MKYLFLIYITSLLIIMSCSNANSGKAAGSTKQQQLETLRQSLLDSLGKYKATVGIAVLELETGDTLTVNNQVSYPMQSVYKFPLALTVLNKVEKGEIKLNQKVLLHKERFEHYSWSPLKRQNPGPVIYMSVDSLLMYMVAYSDNLACDELFELVGGTKVADNYIHDNGFSDIHIKFTELEMHEAVQNMYENATTPYGMTNLLRAFYEKKLINETNTNYLLNYMINDSTSHQRLLGKLPKDIKVAHKTGTGASNDSLINACNDVGIIYLPNGHHLAVSVFIMDSKEGYDQTEKIIALITKGIFDRFN